MNEPCGYLAGAAQPKVRLLNLRETSESFKTGDFSPNCERTIEKLIQDQTN
jgi:hypothetical protein